MAKTVLHPETTVASTLCLSSIAVSFCDWTQYHVAFISFLFLTLLVMFLGNHNPGSIRLSAFRKVIRTYRKRHFNQRRKKTSKKSLPKHHPHHNLSHTPAPLKAHGDELSGLYRRALEGTQLGLWDWHIQSGTVHFDYLWAQMLGYSLDELSPSIETWENLVHPDDMPHVRTALQTHLSGHSDIYQTEHRLRSKHGEWIWVLDRGTVIQRDEHNNPLRAVGTHQDITKRKEADLALINQLQITKSLLKAIPLPVFFKDRDLRYIGCNAAFESFFGITASDILGKTVNQVWPRVMAERFNTADRQLLASPDTVQQYEAHITDQHGTDHIVAFSKSVFYTSDNSIGGITGVFTDLTEQKKAQQREHHIMATLKAIRNVNQLIVKATDAEMLCKDAAEIFTSVKDYNGALLVLLHPDQTLRSWFSSGETTSFSLVINTLETGELPECMQRGEFSDPCASCIHSGQSQQNMCIEMIYRHELYGLLIVATPRPYRADSEEWSLLHEVANDLAFALYRLQLEDARLSAEQQLKERTEFIETVLQRLPVGVLVARGDSPEIANKMFKRIHEWPENQPLQKDHFFSRIIPDANQRSRIIHQIQTAIDTDTPISIQELPILTFFGNPRTIRLSGISLPRQHSYVFITEDITVRVLSEQALRESQTRYRALVEGQSEFIVRWSPEGRLTFVNRAYAKFVGKAVTQLIGQSFFSIFPQDEHLSIIRKNRTLTPQHPATTDVHRAYSAHGTVRWQEWIIKAFFDENQKIVELQSVGRDITDRIKAQQRLRQSEERLRNLVDYSADGIMVIDTDGTITTWNRAMEHITGLQASYTIGRRAWDIEKQLVPRYPAPPSVFQKETMLRFLSTGTLAGGSGNTQRVIRRIDGTDRFVQSVLFPIKKNGSFMAGCITRDITPQIEARNKIEQAAQQLSQTNRKLEQQNKMLNENNRKLKELDTLKSQFLSMASHELRTPLTSIVGFAQTLTNFSDQLSQKEQSRFISIILSQARRLGSLVSSLLDISQIEKGIYQLNATQWFIDECITECIESVNTEQQRFEFQRHPHIQVFADRDKIFQVLINLFDNARRHTPPDGKIRITLERNGDFVKVGVHDNGPGIQPEEQELIFDFFYRSKHQRSKESKGSGIGLAVAKNIILVHGGTIWVESTPPQGSSFFFTLFVPKTAEHSNT